MDKIVSSTVPTQYGDFEIFAYPNDSDAINPHLALVRKSTSLSRPVLLRIHSECITGDLFKSLKCDCGDQLQNAFQKIENNQDGGIILYLRQEGRGIGIIEKLKAYKLQEKGVDTIEANLQLGHQIDERHYDIALKILENLGVKSVRLMTNNPEKLEAVESSPNIHLVERIPIEIKPNTKNRSYLQTKKDSLGHLLKLK